MIRSISYGAQYFLVTAELRRQSGSPLANERGEIRKYTLGTGCASLRYLLHYFSTVKNPVQYFESTKEEIDVEDNDL